LTNSPRPPQVSALSSADNYSADGGDAGDEAPASQSDKRKQSLYFPEAMLEEIHQEAARLERSLSWIVQRAWKTARPEIRKLPSSRGSDGGDES
jgi:uncharacterized small protein (TIGR04563 family)